MNAMQLKGDLNLIEGAVDRADAPESTKRLLREILEWQRGLIDQVDERSSMLEAAVDELLEGVAEGILPETAQVILGAFEQGRHVFATISAFLESDKNPLDELTTKSFIMLIRGAAKSTAVAMETVNEIVISDEGDEEGDESEETEAEAETEADEDDEVEDDAEEKA